MHGKLLYGLRLCCGEMLKDGASSIYGSDAVAGVVNVILKKSFVGGEVSAEYGVSDRMDGRIKHVTGTYGTGDLDVDGHNFYIALEYREQDPIYVSNRPYLAQRDYTNQGGNDLTATHPSAFLNGGLAASTTGYFTTPANVGTPVSFLPGCNATLYYLNNCPSEPNNVLLQTPTQNINVLASYTMDLGGGWQLSTKASLFDVHTSTNVGLAATLGSAAFENPSIGPNKQPTLFAPGGTGLQITVPTTYPGNITGGPAYLNATLPVLLTSSEDSQNYRLAADVTGSYWGWDLTLSGGYSDNLIYTTQLSENFFALNSALNNIADPFLVGTNYHKNSPAVIASIFPTLQSRAEDQLAYVNAEATREIYNLPGGPLSIGVGADYRHQDLDNEAPDGIVSGEFGGNNAFAVGTQNVSALYAEVAAPVFKWLEVDASARYDKYSGSFSNTSPKIGFKVTPIEQLAVRGTYSEGFRAPNPAEAGNAGESFLIGTFPDPVLCPTGDATAPGSYPLECSKQPIFLQPSNPALKPEKSHQYTLGVILEPIKGYSVSVDYYDITIKDQIVPSTADPVVFGTILGTGAGAVRGVPVPEPFIAADGTTVTATPSVGSVAYYDVGYINDSKTTTSGLDLDARAKFDLWRDWGRLTFDFTETHVFHYVQEFNDSGYFELAGTHGPSEVSGDTGNPKDRAQFIVTYDHGPLTVTATTNWTSGYSVTDPSQGQGDCASALEGGDTKYFRFGTAPSQYCRVKAFTDVDLYANYKITKNLSLHASILNLFNRSAPLDFATYGGGTNSSQTPYQPSFAQQGAIGRFYTVGAQYRF